MKNRIRKWLTCAGVALLAAACSTDDVGVFSPIEPSSEPGTVRFTLAMPGHSIPRPATRELTQADENAIESVDVLAFHNSGNNAGKLAVHKVAALVSGTTFEIELPEGDYDMMIVGNASSAIQSAGLVPGTTTKDAAVTALTFTKTGKWDYSKPIPTWGYKNDVDVTENTSLTGEEAIDMHRMLARIDVQLSPMAASGTQTGEGNDNFALTEVYLVNFNTTGQIAPDYTDTSVWDDDGGVVNQGSGIALLPSVPDSPGKQSGMSETAPWTPAQVYTSADGLTANNALRTIYTFEAQNGNDQTRDSNPCLIIGGNYDGDPATTYYRVDFIENTGTTETPTLKYLNLLRNHAYTITITKVTGPGFDTPKQALAAHSFNLQANTMQWEEGGNVNSGFDGVYTMSISNNLFEFDADGNSSNIVVRTNFPDGWTAKVCNDAGVELTGDANWITVPATGAAPQSTLEFTVARSTVLTPRTAYIHITAGRITLKVEVRQERGEAPGVRSVPGVIGYYAKGPRVGQLTLDGDNGDDTDGEIVYVAMFKYGSLIALRSGQGSDLGGNYGSFFPNDIVAAKGYKGHSDDAEALAAIQAEVNVGGLHSLGNWSLIPGTTTPTFPVNNAPDGVGDACSHYFGGGWRLPTRSDVVDFVGSTNTFFGIGPYYSWDANGRTPEDPGIATFPLGTANGTSLPAVGYRTIDGAILESGISGRYLTSDTEHGGVYVVSTMSFSNNGGLSTRDPFPVQHHAAAIRCHEVTTTSITVAPSSLTFEWNDNLEAATKTVTVTADGNWSVTNPDPTNFDVITTIPGTYDNGFDGEFTVVPKTQNTGGTVRNIDITISGVGATPATETVAVTQDHEPLPGIRAVPTVIGYYASGPRKGQLTLDGDNGDDTDGEIVYIAHFKGGSLIATDSQTQGPFVADAIVQAPSVEDGYIGLEALREHVSGFTAGAEAWAEIPFSPPKEVEEPMLIDISRGIGDPCDYYFGDGDADGYGPGSTWRLPTDQDNVDFIGMKTVDNGKSYGGDVYYRWTSGNTFENPGKGTFYMGTDPGAILPAAGQRLFDVGSLYDQRAVGNYTSSKISPTGTARLNLNGSRAVTNGGVTTAGYTVRCVTESVYATSIEVSPESLSFEWDEKGTSATSPAAKTINVTADGPWTVSSYNADFSVELTTWGSYGNGWDGVITVWPRNQNTGTVGKNFQMTITSTSPTPIVKTVPLFQNIQLPSGVRSVPGVIGYYATGPRVGQLTLDGDNGNDADGEVVYVAFFKWSSLFAMGGETTTYFTSADIVAAKGFGDHDDDAEALAAAREHIDKNATNADKYAAIPVATPPTWPTANDGTAGIGDACSHYFGSQWRMPTNNENIAFIGRDAAAKNDTDYGGKFFYKWVVNGTASVTNPGMGVFPQGTAAGASLPAAGLRSGLNYMTGQGAEGRYMSTYASTANVAIIRFYKDQVQFYSSDLTGGYSIRCVPN